MKKLRILGSGLLLVIAVITRTAVGASTSELLQQGLYAEEVEGNIDSAIKIYGEVIKKTDAPRNQIAQALYRQGMCYLKVKDEQAAKVSLDLSADALERVVDRLLASPRYGERWDRHWLDVARYADSNGLDETWPTRMPFGIAIMSCGPFAKTNLTTHS